MDLAIYPHKLQGTVTPPPSKSQAHRAIICAALAEGESLILNLQLSQDIHATLNCMRALGAEAAEHGGIITGANARRGKRTPLPELDCCESGSTLRFLIPIALVVAGGGVFSGRGRLMERPQRPYRDLFQERGIRFERRNGKIEVEGELLPGIFRIAGNVSSQFITGLLFALPLLEADSDIVLTTELESAGYIDSTIVAQKLFGVTVERTETGWHIPGNQHYRAAKGPVMIDADYSNAAFYIIANGLGNDIQVCDMNPMTCQGDKIIVEQEALLDQPGEVVIDVRQCPDLVPALAGRAALRDGQVTKIVNAARLRIKESDRLDTVTTELNKLGARVEQTPDSLIITGVKQLHGGVVNSHNDHRIAMMLAMVASAATDRVILQDAGSVAKSHPGFWEHYYRLGGQFSIWD
ncbi:MAG: 3-phosphoshikimate 1-carboxyvinyltransferase [Clostridiales bacterium]|nr:3-phosphoshikimate 1-carboxyvinyltransferase [Clostridiales bacterium]